MPPPTNVVPADLIEKYPYLGTKDGQTKNSHDYPSPYTGKIPPKQRLATSLSRHPLPSGPTPMLDHWAKKGLLPPPARWIMRSANQAAKRAEEKKKAEEKMKVEERGEIMEEAVANVKKVDNRYVTAKSFHITTHKDGFSTSPSDSSGSVGVPASPIAPLIPAGPYVPRITPQEVASWDVKRKPLDSVQLMARLARQEHFLATGDAIATSKPNFSVLQPAPFRVLT